MTGARDISWGTQNVILIGGENGKPLMRMSADGGEVTPATTLAPGETTHDYPQWLPDGRHFLYMARRGATSANWDTYIGSLDSSDRRLLRGIHAAVRYSPSGHLLFEQDDALMAVPFDLDQACDDWRAVCRRSRRSSRGRARRFLFQTMERSRI